MAKDNRKQGAAARAADADDFDDAKDDAPDEKLKATGAASPDPVPDELAKRIAEIEQLKADRDAARKDAEYAYGRADQMHAELAALKAVAPSLAGGKFVVSVKDGPTATVEVAPGERPEDAFFRQLGIHSCPHRPEVRAAAGAAACGTHYPDGSVRPFGAPV